MLIIITMQNTLSKSETHYVLVGSAAIVTWANVFQISHTLEPQDRDFMVDLRGRAFRQFVEDWFHHKYAGKANKSIFENLVGTDDLFQRHHAVDMFNQMNNVLHPSELLKIYESIDDEFDQKENHAEKIELLKKIISFM